MLEKLGVVVGAVIFVICNLTDMNCLEYHSTLYHLVSLQPLTLSKKFNAILLQLELLNFAARGLRVIVDPEDVLRYCMFLC